jgi:hypothetical protein
MIPAQSPSGRTWPAALTLFFMAGLIPETVATYNSPPLLLLTRPIVFLFISAFYGSVALLVREYIHRRSARWAGVLLLGMAAGCVNEGIIAGTWYKVGYRGYVLIGGVNPAVAVGLTVFHALVSTILPILLAELIFPHVADRSWIGRRGIAACLLLLVLTSATGFAHAADRAVKAVVLAGVAAAVAVALALPRSPDRPASLRSAPSLGRLRLVGAFTIITFYVLFAILPGLIGAAVPSAKLAPWQAPLIIVMSAFFCLIIATGRIWSSRAGWCRRHTLAIITGVLIPPIALSIILPFALRTWEPLATIPMLALLLILGRRHQPVAPRPQVSKEPERLA